MRTQPIHDRELGFTILELLVVMAILAGVASITFPLVYRAHPEATLRATANHLAGELRAARGYAIKTNQQQTLTLDVGRRIYWVAGRGRPQRIANSVGLDFVTLEKERVDGSQARLRFMPDGSATGGNIVLTSGGHKATVEVDWMTGHARVVWSR